MNKSISNKYGFTIVELLIVIVVIAILAAISVVAFSDIQARANNTSRIQVGSQWVKTFQAYYAQEGVLPPTLASTADGMQYCLGTDFPIGGGGVPRCQNVIGTDNNSPPESPALMNEIRSAVGGAPNTKPIRVGSSLVGPWVRKVSAQSIRIYIAIEGSHTAGADCGGGFTVDWVGTNIVSCRQNITF